MASQAQDLAQQESSDTGPSTRGIKWTDEEETWLVINSMHDRTNHWLQLNLPGGNNRSANSISGHFNDMRLKNRLPKAWRAKRWDDQPAWTIEEDAEVVVWHVWQRKFIDPEVFVPSNRAGGAILERAEYLCQDEGLVEAVSEIEERLRLAILDRDMIESDSDGEVDEAAVRRAAVELRREEEHGIEEVHEAVRQSLMTRTP